MSLMLLWWLCTHMLSLLVVELLLLQWLPGPTAVAYSYCCDIWLLTQLWRSDPTAVAFVVAGSFLCCCYGGWVLLPLLLSDDLKPYRGSSCYCCWCEGSYHRNYSCGGRVLPMVPLWWLVPFRFCCWSGWVSPLLLLWWLDPTAIAAVVAWSYRCCCCGRRVLPLLLL